ncbi:MAG: ACP S-malonyltransferase [Erysipelotrichaceae bacterium]
MKLAFLFAGQGSQKVGMGLDLYQAYPQMQTYYDNITLDFDLKDCCFYDSKQLLTQTAYAQPSICATSMGIAQLLTSHGIVPSAVAGLSLGEYSALCYAKSMDLETLLTLTQKRGAIMEAACNDTMGMSAVLDLDGETIGRLCHEVQAHGICEIANYNANNQIVVTGDKKALEVFGELALAHGARRVVPLAVSGAFHSSLMKDAAKALRPVLAASNLQQPQLPLYHNASAQTGCADLVDYLASHMHSSVRFKQTIEQMVKDGIDCFVEIGPGNALTSFVRNIAPDVQVYNVQNVRSFEKVVQALGGQHG